jgi:small subunit ribosomal protein S8
MSMTDPIADMLTRIRNAQVAGHDLVSMPRSNLKVQIVRLLESEGFLGGFAEEPDDRQGMLKIFLKYDGARRGVIRGITRVSTPGRRVYVKSKDVPRVRNGLGVAILTTPRGILTDHQARKAGVGGEVICHVW